MLLKTGERIDDHQDRGGGEIRPGISCSSGRRALRNAFLERWDGREEDLSAALDSEVPAFRAAVRERDLETAMVWAGEGVDLISDVAPAAELVRRIGAEAEECLRRANEFLRSVRQGSAK